MTFHVNWLVASLVLKINAANANDVILVRRVVQRAIQGPIVADGRHHDDAVAGDFPDLQPACCISDNLQTGPLNTEQSMRLRHVSAEGV